MRTTKLFILFLFITALSINAQTVKKTIHVEKAGTLVSVLTEAEANEITHLTLTGNINAIDFKHLRDEFVKLQVLDLSKVNIRAYTGKAGTHPDKLYVYMAGNIPPYAFFKYVNGVPAGKKTLQAIILPDKVRNIEDKAFFDCNALEICQINKNTPPNLLPEALNDTLTAVFLPNGGSDKYRQKVRWENFVFIDSEPTIATINIGTDSSLESEIQKMGLHPKNINFLTLKGKLDSEDFKLIRDYMPNLVVVNMEDTNASVIPGFTFSHKKYLLRVTLPKNLRVIGERSFSNCARLSGELILPATVNSIEYGAFMGCTRLSAVKATGKELNAVADDIFGDDSKTKLIR